MSLFITLSGQRIPYELYRSTRTRRLGVTVFRDGKVRVTLPSGMDVARAEAFLRDKSAWIIRVLARMSKQAARTVPLPAGSYADYKKAARVLVETRLPELNERYGFSYKRISIRNQKTRWGSCSKRGSLSFNYRIAFLRPELADYLLIHELCHLKEMNHSIRFWTLVAKVLPNFRELRRELRAIRLR